MEKIRRRPSIIRLLFAMLIIIGFFNLIVSLIAFSNPTVGPTVALMFLLLGLLGFTASWALLGPKGWVSRLVFLLAIISIVVGMFTLLAGPSPLQLDIILGAVALYMMTRAETKQYLARGAKAITTTLQQPAAQPTPPPPPPINGARCSQCGTENPASANFCIQCGTRLAK